MKKEFLEDLDQAWTMYEKYKSEQDMKQAKGAGKANYLMKSSGNFLAILHSGVTCN